MNRSDPLTIAVVALSIYAAVVTLVLVDRLSSSPREAGEELAPATSHPGDSTGGGSTERIVFEVAFGEGAESVSNRLVTDGVIEDAERFRLLLHFSGSGSALQAGRYEFTGPTPAVEVIRRMRSGATAPDLVAIPEGLRLEEIGEILADEGIVSEAEWARALREPRSSELLDGRPDGASLLGYLLPASYPFITEQTADDVIEAMLTAFEDRLAEDQLLPEVAASGLTLHEVLTLASIVEREAVVKDEQALIASVFLNRLEEGIPLQADPTVQFAIAEDGPQEPGVWWKQELTLDDLAFDSPYNTYEYAGLPPGPIAEPGIDAIRAVLRPADTDYLYFVARGDGSHAFAETLEEHNANVAEFQLDDDE